MRSIRPCSAVLLIALLSANAAIPAASPTALAQAAAVAAAGQTYATAEKAVAALVDAARADNTDALRAALGPGSEKLVDSGDKYADTAARQKFVAAYDEKHQIVAAGDRMILQVGDSDWPLPIPLVQADGRWHFDTQAGAQELVNRRIGRNEIAAIRTCLAYVDAQKAYYAFTGENGNAQYAQHLASSPGKYDGLYWPSAEGQPDSPLAPLMAQAIEEGYPGERVSGKPVPYYGYYFRILTGQGASTTEGARNYVSNGRMTNGFALIAWPASYEALGIMSFIVDQDGIVFQKDLGPQTAQITQAMRLFDADLTWARVEVVN